MTGTLLGHDCEEPSQPSFPAESAYCLWKSGFMVNTCYIPWRIRMYAKLMVTFTIKIYPSFVSIYTIHGSYGYWGAHHLLSFSSIFVAFKSYDLNLGGFQKDFYLRMKSFSWSRSADRRRKGAWLLCLFDVLPSSNHRADGGKESLDVSVGFPFLVEAFVPSTLGSDFAVQNCCKAGNFNHIYSDPRKDAEKISDPIPKWEMLHLSACFCSAFQARLPPGKPVR